MKRREIKPFQGTKGEGAEPMFTGMTKAKGRLFEVLRKFHFHWRDSAGLARVGNLGDLHVALIFIVLDIREPMQCVVTQRFGGCHGVPPRKKINNKMLVELSEASWVPLSEASWVR